MKVRLLKLGHAAKEVDVPAGASVEEAIEASGFETDGYAITTNGTGAMLSSPVHEGDVIALVPKVEGGQVEGGHDKPGICRRGWNGDPEILDEEILDEGNGYREIQGR